MSTPLPGGSVVRAQAIATRGDQTALIQSHFWVSAFTGVGCTDADLAHALDAVVGPALRNFMTDAAAYYGMLVQKIFPAPAAAHVIDQTSAGPGSAGTGTLPGEVAGLTKCGTSLAGRAFRGRMYVPYPDHANLTTDQTELTTSGVGLMGAVTTPMYSPVTVTGGGGLSQFSPVVWHRKANKAGTTTPNSFTLVTGITLELLVATQRRRSARGRPNTPPV